MSFYFSDELSRRILDVSQKNKPFNEVRLIERIATARSEGRTQHALELTGQLRAQVKTEEHQELLRQVTLERGVHLLQLGMLKDALTTFTNALNLGGSPAYRATVAERLAECGAGPVALTLSEQVADDSQRARILQAAVDAAIAKGLAGKADLPLDLHEPFERVLQAFDHGEAGRDEEARTALQAIGLHSPFLEWKVFLRGLLAYYANDDPRANENWARLDTTRLPARLAAPLRIGSDLEFRKALPTTSRDVLLKQAERLKGISGISDTLGVLQSLRAELARDNLAPAFRKVAPILPVLKRDYPPLFPRLAHCFEWAILDHGAPEDILRYAHTFGAPADDPEMAKLTARALEERGLTAQAHMAWQDFIKQIAQSSHWQGETGKRAQALIWARIGHNAHEKASPPSSDMPSFRNIDKEAPLKPSAQQCLRNAIELAPDRQQTYLDLFDIQRHESQTSNAIKTGHEFLRLFPGHAGMLAELGELYLEVGEHKKAQEHLEKALHANPLDRSLRGKLARARQKWGLELTIVQKFDAAREQYQQALHLWEGSRTPLLCQWAVAEMKAKDTPRAEVLVSQVLAEPDQRLACRYALVSESVRAKLTPAQKKALLAELQTALAEPSTPAEILVLLESAAHQRRLHAETFRGQKKQEKAILKFLDQLSFDLFNESQLERLCAGLHALQARRPWLRCLEFSRRRFLKNPVFRLEWVDYYLTAGDPADKTHLAKSHLDAARALVEALPRGERQEQLREQIKSKDEAISALASRPTMFDMMNRIFSAFHPDDDDDLL